jgi:hypothetical protein
MTTIAQHLLQLRIKYKKNSGKAGAIVVVIELQKRRKFKNSLVTLLGFVEKIFLQRTHSNRKARIEIIFNDKN